MIFVRCMLFFCSSRRRHTRSLRDWSSDVCSSDLSEQLPVEDLAGLAEALEPPCDGRPLTMQDPRALPLRVLRDDPLEDRQVEPGLPESIVAAKRLRRERALAALALEALHGASVARALERAAALVLEPGALLALRRATWAEGGLECHGSRLLGGLGDPAQGDDAAIPARSPVRDGFPEQRGEPASPRAAARPTGRRPAARSRSRNPPRGPCAR